MATYQLQPPKISSFWACPLSGSKAKAERHTALDSPRGSSDDRQLQPHNEVVSIPLIVPDYQMHSNKVLLRYQSLLI